MRTHIGTCATAVLIAVVSFGPVSSTLGNGGPFVVKYPNGDPAAKGIPAPLDPSLKPQRETRLRVLEENLTIEFKQPRSWAPRKAEDTTDTAGTPLATVSATYRIENPTDKNIQVNFGFPILRGIYINPLSMTLGPAVNVKLGKRNIHSQIISNSQIYAIIRMRAREAIEKAIAADQKLAELVARLRVVSYVRSHSQNAARSIARGDQYLTQAATDDALLSPVMNVPPERTHQDREIARRNLQDYLKRTLKWNDRDTALMVEFATLDFGRPVTHHPFDRETIVWTAGNANENLGPLSAIGEQKATQFFAVLASRFDPDIGSSYESIFTAWGGDVRERSVDIKTGQIRPREITVPKPAELKIASSWTGEFDSTIYARVDYLDPNAKLEPHEKASCETVLKNLPVIFTFAPMNLIYYKADFPSRSTETLTVSYDQFAYCDTREPHSYQLAYVVHPASLWDSFGPIRLKVLVPKGTVFTASVPCKETGTENVSATHAIIGPTSSDTIPFAVYESTLEDKTGELFLGIEVNSWQKTIGSHGKVAASEKTESP